MDRTEAVRVRESIRGLVNREPARNMRAHVSAARLCRVRSACGDDEFSVAGESGGRAFRQIDSRAFQKLRDRWAGGEFGLGLAAGSANGSAPLAIIAIKRRRKIGRNIEGPGENVFSGFRLRNERDREVIDLVAEFRLIADVFQRIAERDIAKSKLFDAECSWVGMLHRRVVVRGTSDDGVQACLFSQDRARWYPAPRHAAEESRWLPQRWYLRSRCGE